MGPCFNCGENPEAAQSRDWRPAHQLYAGEDDAEAAARADTDHSVCVACYDYWDRKGEPRPSHFNAVKVRRQPAAGWLAGAAGWTPSLAAGSGVAGGLGTRLSASVYGRGRPGAGPPPFCCCPSRDCCPSTDAPPWPLTLQAYHRKGQYTPTPDQEAMMQATFVVHVSGRFDRRGVCEAAAGLILEEAGGGPGGGDDGAAALWQTRVHTRIDSIKKTSGLAAALRRLAEEGVREIIAGCDTPAAALRAILSQVKEQQESRDAAKVRSEGGGGRGHA